MVLRPFHLAGPVGLSELSRDRQDTGPTIVRNDLPAFPAPKARASMVEVVNVWKNPAVAAPDHKTSPERP